MIRISRTYPGVSTVVSPRDAMWAGDVRAYFTVGASAQAAIERSLAAAHHGSPASVLDFACGHGRVARFMRSAWPDAALTASDLDPDGGDFCARQFGATSVPSHDPLDDLDVGGPFDLIWSGSLLTHFDAHRWPEALGWFRRHLAPDGVLIFSNHGALSAAILGGDDEQARRLALPLRYGLRPEAAAKMAHDYEARGFGFAPEPNPLFGLSVASPEWVKRQVDAAALRVVRYEEATWADHHDVVTCVRAG